MHKTWWPSWLYEFLPLGYLLFGLLMFAAFGDEPLGIVSGSLLCVTAVLIWAMRVYARSKGAGRG